MRDNTSPKATTKIELMIELSKKSEDGESDHSDERFVQSLLSKLRNEWEKMQPPVVVA